MALVWVRGWQTDIRRMKDEGVLRVSTQPVLAGHHTPENQMPARICTQSHATSFFCG
jgi:hypothetical protein